MELKILKYSKPEGLHPTLVSVCVCVVFIAKEGGH